jgi:feruloyl esterase
MFKRLHQVSILSIIGMACCFVALIIAGAATAPAQQQPAATIASLPAVAPVMDCAQLPAAHIAAATDTPLHITAAAVVQDGVPAAYCEVQGYVEPHIQFEVRLPVKGWTQRFLETGCGGQCGNLEIRLTNYKGCYPAEHGELALASTDMGHRGGIDGVWAKDNAQAKIDFAYRGVHETAVAAKAVIAKYYGQEAKYSYFTGCSDGGRQALMEAERYPSDFNGLVAGAPGMNFITQNTFYHGWNARVNTGADGRPIITADDLPILHQAALSACDELDGLKDGLISDPRACHFDPSVLLCKAGQNPDGCLSAAKVQAAREIYKGAHTADGEQLVISGPEPGSELAWAGVYVPKSAGQPIASRVYAEGTLKYLVFKKDPPASYTIGDLRFDRATFDAIKPMHALYDTTDPDLSAFINAGGKLLLWHGLQDPHISPLNSIAYYGAIQALLGKEKVDGSVRLYLFPGVYHCGGGEGPFNLDMLTPIMVWVERGTAPYELIASRQGLDSADSRASKPAVTRPVFPYPLVARYTGKGDVNDAANWIAEQPKTPSQDRFNWRGASFYRSHYEKWCTGDGAAMTCRDSR